MNVPLDSDGKITDDHRIQASLPTIKLAMEKGAAIIISSHLGQPKGKVVESLSLSPIATRLGELLNCKVNLAPDCVSDATQALAKALNPGEVLLLENTRFHDAETKNDPEFSKQLASLAEVYINDAFASDHRAHASTCGIASFIDERAAGLTLQTEMDFFAKALSNPVPPLAAIFGGAKVSTKMKAIRNVAKKADLIVVGGAMANTFFVAQGHNVGKSLYEPEQVEEAKEAIAILKENNCKLVLPVDVVVADKLAADATTSIVAIDSIDVM
ncbi:UNVERIFIED_CONTAM: hypothetical protein GTU68_042887 [Idotea baltica]|nr:hypothetical protein [Idotea baltica]